MAVNEHTRPRFEAQVLAAFERTLFEYCQLAVVHPLVDPARLELRITVLTGPPVETIRDRLRALAGQLIERELAARSTVVVFARDLTDRPPGYRILIQPPLPDAVTDPGGATAPPAGSDQITEVIDPTDVTSRSAGRPVVLTIAYGDRLRWSYPLIAAPVWIPVGRGLVAGGTRSSIRVPDFATAVPRGSLLLLRHLPEATTLRRAAQRPEYTVRVDGQPVPPGGTVTAGGSGTIHYALAHGRSTALTYRFERSH